MKKGTERTRKNIFYKNNPRGGISLIVLVITIIVVIILAAAVIISLQNNNPMVEANKARINSDVANMQAIFTNTVGKIMAENQDVVTIVGGQLYTETTGNKKTRGEATYQILGTDRTAVVEGKIIFGVGEKLGTTYYTGKELPLYSSDTKWNVDSQGLLSVEVGGVSYGEGEKVESGEEIADSENPMLQQWTITSTTDFHNTEYINKISKIKFATNVKVPESKIESWDVSEAKDGSVMAWVQDDGNEGYILTIAGKNKIFANSNSGFLFYKFSKVTEIENINLLDTSKVTNMEGMFRFCENLTTLNLSNFNTNNVTNMEGMFYCCYKLKDLDFSNFNTTKVTNMSSMFYYCRKLSSLNLSSFNTSEVKDMSNMFNGCTTLININLNNFDTSKVTNMQYMFESCNKLETLNLSSFNTTNVTNMERMFSTCVNLENISFGNYFNTGKVTNMFMMFSSCEKLVTTFNVKGNVSNYENMFIYAAINTGSKIIVNYTAETSSLVDNMIATKSATSNVVKGTQID